jgi:hypothetical protein
MFIENAKVKTGSLAVAMPFLLVACSMERLLLYF